MIRCNCQYVVHFGDAEFNGQEQRRANKRKKNDKKKQKPKKPRVTWAIFVERIGSMPPLFIYDKRVAHSAPTNIHITIKPITAYVVRT